MSNIVLLAEDFDESPWEIAQNTIEPIEASPSGRPNDPNAWDVGYSGDTIFVRYLKDLEGNPTPLYVQVTWTAIDTTVQFRRGRGQFDPTINILDVRLVGADEVVYFVENPTDAPDPDYTWQGVFEYEHELLAEEAIDDAGDQLFVEMN